MFWYRIYIDTEYKGSILLKSNNRDIITTPVTYNDVVYGTIENPLYGSGLSKPSISRSTESVDIAIEGFRTYSAKRGNNIVGSLSGNIAVEKTRDIYYYTTKDEDPTLEDAILTGKWKPHDRFIQVDGNLTGYEIVLYATVYYEGSIIYTNRVSHEPEFSSNQHVYMDEMSLGHIAFGNRYSTNTENTFVDFGSAEQHVPKFIKDYFETNFDRVYDNTYTVKNDDGTVLAQSEPYMPPIKKTSLFWSAGIFRLTLSTIEDYPIILEWSNPTPEGKKLKGLAIEPNGKIIVPLGDRSVDILRSVDFYMVYEDIEPLPVQPLPRPIDRPLPDDAYNINLYKNTAEANRVDKTDYLTSVRTLRGVMRESSSVTDLTITIQYPTYPDFNYVRIPELKRYYFVNDITLINANMYELDLSVDPLMSYKEAILGLTAFVDRNENLSNPRIIDKKRVIEQGVDVEEKVTANQLFNLLYDDGDYMFVLNGYKFKTHIGYINLEGT